MFKNQTNERKLFAFDFNEADNLLYWKPFDIEKLGNYCIENFNFDSESVYYPVNAIKEANVTEHELVSPQYQTTISPNVWTYSNEIASDNNITSGNDIPNNNNIASDNDFANDNNSNNNNNNNSANDDNRDLALQLECQVNKNSKRINRPQFHYSTEPKLHLAEKIAAEHADVCVPMLSDEKLIAQGFDDNQRDAYKHAYNHFQRSDKDQKFRYISKIASQRASLKVQLSDEVLAHKYNISTQEELQHYREKYAHYKPRTVEGNPGLKSRTFHYSTSPVIYQAQLAGRLRAKLRKPISEDDSLNELGYEAEAKDAFLNAYQHFLKPPRKSQAANNSNAGHLKPASLKKKSGK